MLYWNQQVLSLWAWSSKAIPIKNEAPAAITPTMNVSSPDYNQCLDVNIDFKIPSNHKARAVKIIEDVNK